MNTEMIYTRRGFVKMAAGTVAAAALVAAGAESIDFSKAFAATSLDGLDKSKTYTITANLYVPAELNAVIHMDAYLTNLTTPTLFGARPTTPVADNAVLSFDADKKPVITINQLNNTFGLYYIDPASSNGGTTVTQQGEYLWNKGGHVNRIQPIGFTINDVSLENYEFGAKEYADFSLARGDKEWKVTLIIDWDSIN